MTQPTEEPKEVAQAPALSLTEMQTIAGTNYLTLLNEISQLGMTGFMAVIDSATEDELRALLSACNVVHHQIVKFRGG